jgi:hypothetical protein
MIQDELSKISYGKEENEMQMPDLIEKNRVLKLERDEMK